MEKDDEPRLKLARIDKQQMLTAVCWWHRGDSITLSRFVGIPEDTRVLEVSYDIAHRGFVLLLWHPSFELIPDGAEPPFVQTRLEHVKFKLDERTLKWENVAESPSSPRKAWEFLGPP